MVPFVAASTTTIESKSSEDVTESWWWLVIQPGSTTTTAAAALDGNNKNIDGNYAGFSAAKASLRVRELDVSVISTPYPTPGLRSTPAPTSTASPGPQTSAATESDGGGSGGSDDWAVATVILGVAAAIVVVSGGLFLACELDHCIVNNGVIFFLKVYIYLYKSFFEHSHKNIKAIKLTMVQHFFTFPPFFFPYRIEKTGQDRA